MRIMVTGRFLAAAPVAMIGLFVCDATAPDEQPEATMHATEGGEPWLGRSQARFQGTFNAPLLQDDP